MLEQTSRKQSIRKFMFVLFMVSFALFIAYYGQNVARYNTTILAFNYSYGFISRGLLGTLYLWLDQLLPMDFINYESVVNITFIATTFVVFLMFFLLYSIVKKCQDIYLTNVEYVALFFAIFFVPFVYSSRNMGRPDTYLLFFTFIGLLLIIYEKAEWLVIPLSILSVMVHQGYVFMFYNIFMYLFAYKILNNTGKKRQKYIILLTLSFLSVSAFFLYFEFFSHVNGEEIYDEVVALAISLSEKGEAFSTLVNHEILGIDPWNEEWPYHIYNFIELPMFCIFMLPYIILGVRLFRNILRAAETKADKLKYLLIPLFSLTILPCYILKIDYGRWVMAGIVYFALVILALCAMKDKVVPEQLHLLMEDIKQRYSFAPILLVYIATMIPFYDIHINMILDIIAEWLDVNYLHIF